MRMSWLKSSPPCVRMKSPGAGSAMRSPGPCCSTALAAVPMSWAMGGAECTDDPRSATRRDVTRWVARRPRERVGPGPIGGEAGEGPLAGTELDAHVDEEERRTDDDRAACQRHRDGRVVGLGCCSELRSREVRREGERDERRRRDQV